MSYESCPKHRYADATNGCRWCIHRQMVTNELDIRDRFAMAALTGMLADGGPGNFDEFAKDAYLYADAMLAVRAQKGTP